MLRRKILPGDKTASILRPFVRKIDQTFGTDLEHCESCDKIRKLLNDKKYMEAFKERFK